MRKISINKALSDWGSYSSVSEVKRRLGQSREVVLNVRRKLQFNGAIGGTEWMYSLDHVDWDSAYWKDGILIAYTSSGTRLTIDLVYARSDVREVSSVARKWVRDQRDDERRKRNAEVCAAADKAEEDARKAVTSAEKKLAQAEKDYAKAQEHARAQWERTKNLPPSKWSPEAKSARAQRRADAHARFLLEREQTA